MEPGVVGSLREEIVGIVLITGLIGIRTSGGLHLPKRQKMFPLLRLHVASGDKREVRSITGEAWGEISRFCVLGAVTDTRALKATLRGIKLSGKRLRRLYGFQRGNEVKNRRLRKIK